MITSHFRPPPEPDASPRPWWGGALARAGGFSAMLENPKFVPMARPYASSRRALEGVVRAERQCDRERLIDDPTPALRSLQRQEALMSTGGGKYIEPTTDASTSCIDFFRCDMSMSHLDRLNLFSITCQGHRCTKMMSSTCALDNAVALSSTRLMDRTAGPWVRRVGVSSSNDHFALSPPS